MEILKTKKLKEKILKEIKDESKLLNSNVCLAVISIGNDEVSSIFFKERVKMCEFLGWKIKHYCYEFITESSLLALIDNLNKDCEITGIMIDLPLPRDLNYFKIFGSIAVEKDVDALNPLSYFNYSNNNFGFLSSTVLGIIMFFDGYDINVEKKKVVILNRSNRIGKPLFDYFLTKDCTVTLLHKNSFDVDFYLENADIIITATGCNQIFDGLKFKKDAIVVDVGCCYYNGILSGDITSDVNLDNVKYLIPSIGGIGPMTNVALAKNLRKSYYLLKSKWNDEC